MTDDTKLFYCGKFISEEEFGRAKISAYSRGTVMEKDELSIFAFGIAYTFHLTGGLSDPDSLSQVQQTLDNIGYADIGEPENTDPLFTDNAILQDSDRHISEEKNFYPLALGSFDFLHATPGKLHIPEVTFIKNKTGPAAVIVVAQIEDVKDIFRKLPDFLLTSTDDNEELCPDEFRLKSSFSHQRFLDITAEAIRIANSGEISKVVLAREIIVTANRKFNRKVLLERLRSLHPTCLTFAVGNFIGATPELLIKKDGNKIVSSPLAGTVARSGTIEEDKRLAESLSSSAKNLREHGYVVDYIIDKLSAFCQSPPAYPHPELLFLRNVTHLQSNITGELKLPYPDILTLVSALHPTPAIAGVPPDKALKIIEELECIERKHYSAPIGFIRKGGDGEFYLGIRSAEVKDNRAKLIAGVGIVKDSVPADELTETQLKLQALLAVIVRP